MKGVHRDVGGSEYASGQSLWDTLPPSHPLTFPSDVLQYSTRCGSTCPRPVPETPADSRAPDTRASPMSSETCRGRHAECHINISTEGGIVGDLSKDGDCCITGYITGELYLMWCPNFIEIKYLSLSPQYFLGSPARRLT